MSQPLRAKVQRLLLSETVGPFEKKPEDQMKNALLRLWKEEEGQDLTEYALLLVLLSLAAIASLSSLAQAINNVFSEAVTNLT